MAYPQNLPNNREVSPAMGSLKRFGGMIKENILDPTAKVMSYANPINVAQRIPEYGRQIKEGMQEYDQWSAQQKRDANKAAAIKGQSPAAQIYSPGQRSTPRALPSGNLNALNGVNQTAEPVDIQSIERDIPSQQPTSFQQGDLPKGYIPDDDPRMVKRRAEAGQVHQDRLADIARIDAERPQLPRGSSASMNRGFRDKKLPGQDGPLQLQGNRDFLQRHQGTQANINQQWKEDQTRGRRIDSTGNQSQNAIASRANQANLDRQSVERQSQLGRQSRERIANLPGTKKPQFAAHYKPTYDEHGYKTGETFGGSFNQYTGEYGAAPVGAIGGINPQFKLDKDGNKMALVQ